MSNFVTKRISAVKGKQEFYQLARATKGCKDPIGALDEYEKRLESQYHSNFRGLLSIMNLVANLESVPVNKFRDITPKGDVVREYEFKHGDLRVYAIKIQNGKLIILGGFKNKQPQDIVTFRSIKKQYLSQLL